MLGKGPTLRLASILLVAGVVFAMPLASAFGMGVDAESVDDVKNAGATPQYGQYWAGRWMKTSGWGGFENALRSMRDQGVTPIIMWYYWGDDISPDCVTNGCTGRSKGEWDAMAKELGTRANAIMGGKQFYVVIEPEFNKNGIKTWETFDGYLENQAKIIRGAAPNADFVAGFGHWGGWDIFDRYVAQCDLVGFQILYGSTRNDQATAIGTADYMISKAKELKSRWGKPIMVFDLGIATYGGWDGVQEKALQGIASKRSALDSAGVKAVVWRYLYDNDQSSGYFGPAESTWGVKERNGANKPGYDDLIALLKGASTTPPPSGTTSPTPPPAPAPTDGASVFSEVTGNEWWVQAKVANSPTKVEARVNGGSWVALENKGWGWAKSVHAATGSKVELRATYSGGATATATYAWPPGSAAAPAPAPSTGAFDATFTGVKVQEWWVQATVSGTQSISKVEARVNGGAWQTLAKQSYGWSKSIHVLKGQKVEFRATSTSGATDISDGYSW